MPVLKFTNKNGSVHLDNYRLEDITHDKRTVMINKESLMKEMYCVEKKANSSVYIAVNDMFFRLSKLFNKEKIPISAMMIRCTNNVPTIIVIVPSKSYVFWNGYSIEPEEWNPLGNQNEDEFIKSIEI